MVSPVDESDMPALFEVYKQCEDFLALGPVPVASAEMIRADIDHSRGENGQYCVIREGRGRVVGVIDFIAKSEGSHTSVLSLLMIAKSWRSKGYGRAVVSALEEYLKKNYEAERVDSWVQTNNREAIPFYKRIGYHLSTEPHSQPDGTVTYQMTKML